MLLLLLLQPWAMTTVGPVGPIPFAAGTYQPASSTAPTVTRISGEGALVEQSSGSASVASSASVAMS